MPPAQPTKIEWPLGGLITILMFTTMEREWVSFLTCKEKERKHTLINKLGRKSMYDSTLGNYGENKLMGAFIHFMSFYLYFHF